MSPTRDTAAQTDRLSHPGQDDAGIPKERVAGLFDGIVAITATLLILDIGIPDTDGLLTVPDLLESARSVLHWAVSFVMVAVIWTEFHFVFAHSRRWDGGLLVVTFFQMALISVVPFAAELVGSFPGSLLATLIFAVVMGANGLLVSVNIYILQQKSHLHTMEHSPGRLGRRRRAQIVIYPLSIAVSVLAALIHDPALGILAWALCPLALAYHLRRDGSYEAEFQSTEEAAA